MSGVHITPAPPPDVAAAIVAALTLAGSSPRPAPAGDAPGQAWRRQARAEAVGVDGDTFDGWNTRHGRRP